MDDQSDTEFAEIDREIRKLFRAIIKLIRYQPVPVQTCALVEAIAAVNVVLAENEEEMFNGIATIHQMVAACCDQQWRHRQIDFEKTRH